MATAGRPDFRSGAISPFQARLAFETMGSLPSRHRGQLTRGVWELDRLGLLSDLSASAEWLGERRLTAVSGPQVGHLLSRVPVLDEILLDHRMGVITEEEFEARQTEVLEPTVTEPRTFDDAGLRRRLTRDARAVPLILAPWDGYGLESKWFWAAARPGTIVGTIEQQRPRALVGVRYRELRFHQWDGNVLRPLALFRGGCQEELPVDQQPMPITYRNPSRRRSPKLSWSCHFVSSKLGSEIYSRRRRKPRAHDYLRDRLWKELRLLDLPEARGMGKSAISFLDGFVFERERSTVEAGTLHGLWVVGDKAFRLVCFKLDLRPPRRSSHAPRSSATFEELVGELVEQRELDRDRLTARIDGIRDIDRGTDLIRLMHAKGLG
jgi:hypothetical protein